jgi:hypothetical protein
MSLFQSLGNHISKTIATLGLGLALVSGSAFAEENQTLDEAYQILVNSYYSINGFYNFSANQADKQQNEIIQDSIDNIDSLIESLGDSFVDTPEAEAVTDAKEKWQAYRKKLSQNVKEVEKTGYPDLRLAGDMANSNIAFNDAISNLYDTISAQSKPSEMIQTAYDASTMLALMMTKYSARSTSTVSQAYSSGDADITIDALAIQFEQKLDNLTQLTKNNEEAVQLMDSARTQWDFIKSSYINYNENRVNFIVNLYSKKIISNIVDSVKG